MVCKCDAPAEYVHQDTGEERCHPCAAGTEEEAPMEWVHRDDAAVCHLCGALSVDGYEWRRTYEGWECAVCVPPELERSSAILGALMGEPMPGSYQ